MLCGSSTNAQVHFGLKAGANYNIFTQKDADASKGVGIHLGGYVRVPISEGISFQPEVLYVPRGIKQTIDNTFSYTDFSGFQNRTEKGEVRLFINYIQVPLLVGFEVAEGLRLHVGPVPALRVGYKATMDYTITTTGNGTTQQTTVKGDNKDDSGVRDFDFGATAGLNYELGSGLNFGASYLRSFTTLGESGGSNYNGIFISVGYTLGMQ